MVTLCSGTRTKHLIDREGKRRNRPRPERLPTERLYVINSYLTDAQFDLVFWVCPEYQKRSISMKLRSDV